DEARARNQRSAARSASWRVAGGRDARRNPAERDRQARLSRAEEPFAMLEIRVLEAWYGASHVLQKVDIDVARGEIVCLIGRNGAGKTTTLKSVMGLIDKVRGSVE